MAEKNRKSKRHFNLEKPVERHFDIEKDESIASAPAVAPSTTPVSPATDKKSAHSVETPDKGKTNVGTSNNGNTDNGTEGGSRGGSKKWIAAVAGLLVAGGLAYHFAGSDSQGNEGGVLPDSTTVLNDTTGQVANETDSTTANFAQEEGGESESVQANNVKGGEGNTQPNNSNAATNVKDDTQASNTVKSSASGNEGKVDEKKVSASPSNVSTENTGGNGSVEEEAQKVLLGVYGNNPERRKALGANYRAIQKRVNELYRKGLVR